MKTSSRIALVILMLAACASAQVLYDNGPINGNAALWSIAFGYVVSDTLDLSGGSTVTGFSFGVWNEEFVPMTSVEWSLTSAENGGTVYGSGIAHSSGGSGGTLLSQYLSVNNFGYEIDEITVSGLGVNFSSGGTYWLNLQNAEGSNGDYYFWDENSGVGCKSNGCPSLASENTLGTIPSESFTIIGGSGGTTPEPGSFLLLASGIFGLACVLRRKLL